MMNIHKTIDQSLALSFIFFALMILGGCSQNTAGVAPHYFGNAVEQNIAAQVINPDSPAVNEEPVYNGNRTIVAQKRYETDKVETPQATTTSALSYSGSGK